MNFPERMKSRLSSPEISECEGLNKEAMYSYIETEMEKPKPTLDNREQGLYIEFDGKKKLWEKI